jgi:Secretion system C-terminal sorting domain
LLVSPNPTIGIAHIALTAKGNEKSAECTVYDSYGKLVQTTRLARWDTMLRGNIALDRFPAGVYFVRVMGLDRQYVARVVKK